MTSSQNPLREAWYRRLLGAFLFYTGLPVPFSWGPEFRGIACFAPWVGLVLGAILGGFSWVLTGIGLPQFSQAGVLVGGWVLLTGGLHLDGAMDTADGLAVQSDDIQRRLRVMGDSHTGAFGVMAVIFILGLKTLTLGEVSSPSIWILMAAAGWGRWGQLLAIARYPYLKPEGKGAMHKQDLRLPQDGLMGTAVLVLFHGLWFIWDQQQWLPNVALALSGLVASIGIGIWFQRQLGGQTGDTYGAIVEWTEVWVLMTATLVL